MIAIARNPPPDEPDCRSFALVPVDAAGNAHGDGIPLRKTTLLIGRRGSCDIVLRFPNVSAHHCQMSLRDGQWYVRDLASRNGVRINGIRVKEVTQLDVGDILSIAKHLYQLRSSP